jgi:signal transduction histidine kinase
MFIYQSIYRYPILVLTLFFLTFSFTAFSQTEKNRDDENVYITDIKYDESIDGKQKSAFELQEMGAIFIRSGNYRRATIQFEMELEHIREIPSELAAGNTSINEVCYIIDYLSSSVVVAYLNLHEPQKAKQTLALIKQINGALLLKLRNNIYIQTHLKLKEYFASFKVEMYAKEYKLAKKYLDLINQTLQNKTIYPADSAKVMDVYLSESRINYFLAIQQNDSAEFYIKKYESRDIVSDDQLYQIENFKANLYQNLNQYQAAFDAQNGALNYLDSINSKLMERMDELLYSYIEAEYSAIELEKAQQAKKNRLMWIFVISALAIVIIIVVYRTMLSQNKRAKTRIENLNNTVNEQIATMEEKKYQSIRNEQQRLGQDLHDNFSASIASMRHQIELIQLDTEDEVLKPQLADIASQLSIAYEAARTTSHEWHEQGEDLNGKNFEKSIRSLIEGALPEKYYNTEIHIDDDVFSNTAMGIRIDILRIIQKAITNIISHSSAKNVSLLIYEDLGHTIISIKNDGNTATGQQTKTSDPTLQNIEKRISKLQGSFQIQSDSTEREMIFSIPCNYLG